MKAVIEGSELVIRIAVNDPPTPSKSGKSMIVASTSGTIEVSTIMIGGKPLKVGLNAYTSR